MTRRILITGATTGIGRVLAQRLAPGAELLLTGRRTKTEVHENFPAGAAYVVADQTDPQGAREAVSKIIADLNWDRLDLAILNAGAGFAVDPANESADAIGATLDINATTPIVLAHRLFPLLHKANGKLVLIGSVAHRGAPGFASYSASKAALHGFGRALAEEWRGRVAVQVIHPGPTHSGMHAKAGYDPKGAERFFLSTETMARMIDRIMAGNRPVATASYARYLSGFYWARSS